MEFLRDFFTRSKSELTHLRKWSDGFLLGGQGNPDWAKNCRNQVVLVAKLEEKNGNKKQGRDKQKKTERKPCLMSISSRSKVDCPASREKKEIIEESKHFAARLMNGEKNSPSIPRQAPQCLRYKECGSTGKTTIRIESIRNLKRFMTVLFSHFPESNKCRIRPSC